MSLLPNLITCSALMELIKLDTLDLEVRRIQHWVKTQLGVRQD